MEDGNMSPNSITVAGRLAAAPTVSQDGRRTIARMQIITARYENGRPTTDRVEAIAIGPAARNAAQSLRSGDRIIAAGKIATHPAPDGATTGAAYLAIEDIAPTLRETTATVTRTATPRLPKAGTRSVGRRQGGPRYARDHRQSRNPRDRAARY